MRWNDTTHIFEMSTNDGASWSILPLNASVINEGALDNARFPANLTVTGNLGQNGVPANVPRLDGQNTFTNGDQRIIGNPFSRLLLSDTSQPANTRVFDIANYSQSLQIRAMDDALSTIQSSPLGI